MLKVGQSAFGRGVGAVVAPRSVLPCSLLGMPLDGLIDASLDEPLDASPAADLRAIVPPRLVGLQGGA